MTDLCQFRLATELSSHGLDSARVSEQDNACAFIGYTDAYCL
jgi:hypothetical protein